MLSFKKEDIVILTFICVSFVLSLFIIESFIIPLMFTLILVYILNPMYKYINKKVFHSKALTSLFLTTLILLVFIIPTIYGILEINNQIGNLDNNQMIASLNKLDLILQNNLDLNLNIVLQYDLFSSKIKENIKDIIYLVPKFIFQIFIILFFYYYFSKNCDKEIKFLEHMFESRKLNYLKNKLDKLLNGIIYGQILVRFIQAILGMLGFLLIGVNGAIIWGILMFFVAFIPMIGTGIIWGPLALLYFLKDDLFTSFGIIIIGIIISTIDNLLLPKIISNKTNIGPVFTLISIIGGIEFFGVYGIILGPFTLVLLFALLEELFKEIRNSNPKLRKYIWTQTERELYRELNSEEERLEFMKNINKKYELKEKKKKI